MVTVAIAGGTGNIGRTLAEVIKQNPKHQVLILSRRVPEVQDEKAPVFAVNYDSVESLAKFFEKHHVHTVISTIQIMDEKSGAVEISLVRAAAKSAPTKRFISSDWGLPIPPPELQMAAHPIRAATAEELRKTDLEWSTVHNGFFLDYFGLPHIQSQLAPFTSNIDMVDRAAAIPGTGEDTISFTYSYDMAKFVEAALDLPHWDEALICCGDNCTLNEIVRMAEEATGDKFSVSYDDVGKLERSQVSELPAHATAYRYFPKPMLQAVLAQFGLLIVNGAAHLPDDNTLNDKFPDIKTKTAQEVIGFWRGK